jgi:hypothetical protein
MAATTAGSTTPCASRRIALIRRAVGSFVVLLVMSCAPEVRVEDTGPDAPDGSLDAPMDTGLPDAPEDCGVYATDAPSGTSWCGPIVCGTESLCCRHATFDCARWECVPRGEPYPTGCRVDECDGSGDDCALGEGCCAGSSGTRCLALDAACDDWRCRPESPASAPCPAGYECVEIGLEANPACRPIDAGL